MLQAIGDVMEANRNFDNTESSYQLWYLLESGDKENFFLLFSIILLKKFSENAN